MGLLAKFEVFLFLVFLLGALCLDPLWSACLMVFVHWSWLLDFAWCFLGVCAALWLCLVDGLLSQSLTLDFGLLACFGEAGCDRFWPSVARLSVSFCHGFCELCGSAWGLVTHWHEADKRDPFVGFAPRGSFSRVLWLFLLWTFGSRIGEAAVPGPQGPPSWSVGVCNPAGVGGKAHLFDAQADLWLICETHLTKAGERSFRKALCAARSDFRWFVPGAPVPPRSVASELGTWSGVGALSSWPTRAVPHAWPVSVFDSGRLQISCTYLHGFWLTSIVAYGFPTGPTHPQARQKTDALIASVCDRLEACKGPCIFGGDLNQDLDSLPSIGRLKALGFVEAQTLYFQQTGCLPRPTCRRKTQRDFLFLSEELVPLFRSCHVDSSIWVDHSIVCATFVGGVSELQFRSWPRPAPLDWNMASPARPVCAVDFSLPADPTTQYRQVWQQIEAEVPCSVPSLRQSVGRAQCFAPVVTQVSAPHVKLGRRGDPAPPVVSQHWTHFHRFRQSRRLQSYVRLVAACQSLAHVEHRLALWNKILRSPGYPGSFIQWWNSEVDFVGWFRLDGHPPSLAQASIIHQLVVSDSELVAATLQKHNVYVARLKRQRDPHHVFRAVRRDPPSQVDVIIEPQTAVVESVLPAEFSFTLDRPLTWDDSSPVLVAGVPVSVVALCVKIRCGFLTLLLLLWVILWSFSVPLVPSTTCLRLLLITGSPVGPDTLRCLGLIGGRSWILPSRSSLLFRLLLLTFLSTWFVLALLRRRPKLLQGLTVSPVMMS